MFLFSKSTTALGIDIGTSFIKAVQVNQTPEKNILESYGIVNVVYQEHSAAKLDVIKQTAEVLKTLFEKAHFTSKQVMVSLPSNVAFVSILNLPSMPEKEMQKSIEFQAKKYIPLPLSEVNLGWKLLEDIPAQAPSKDEAAVTRVLLTAVPKNVINNYLQLFQMAGLEPQALEIESLSLIRSLLDPQATQSVLIVDIGARSTILSLLVDGYLSSTRHVSVGGDTITNSIAKSMGISFERADQLKLAGTEGQSSSPASQISRNVIELIKAEIEQFLLIAENQGKKIGRIILTGGGSKLTGLSSEFASLVPVVEPGQPLKKVSFNPQLQDKLQQLEPQLGVAIGLAIRPLNS